MQPKAQISLCHEYSPTCKSISGARYHNVATFGVKFLGGFPKKINLIFYI